MRTESQSMRMWTARDEAFKIESDSVSRRRSTLNANALAGATQEQVGTSLSSSGAVNEDRRRTLFWGIANAASGKSTRNLSVLPG